MPVKQAVPRSAYPLQSFPKSERLFEYIRKGAPVPCTISLGEELVGSFGILDVRVGSALFFYGEDVPLAEVVLTGETEHAVPQAKLSVSVIFDRFGAFSKGDLFLLDYKIQSLHGEFATLEKLPEA